MMRRYNIWQRLTLKPEKDRQREKLERLRQKLVEHAESDNATTQRRALSEVEELLRLLP